MNSFFRAQQLIRETQQECALSSFWEVTRDLFTPTFLAGATSLLIQNDDES
jgi:hypothetical protein